jgi:hypothetical protein
VVGVVETDSHAGFLGNVNPALEIGWITQVPGEVFGIQGKISVQMGDAMKPDDGKTH